MFFYIFFVIIWIVDQCAVEWIMYLVAVSLQLKTQILPPNKNNRDGHTVFFPWAASLSRKQAHRKSN